MTECDECKKKCTQYFVLNVVDERPGATSFMRTFDANCWQKHIIDCVARAITDFPMLQEYFETRLKIYKGMRDEK